MKILLLLSLFLVATTVSAAESRPNIVLIITDDMGFSDVGCYGGEIDTPNIDSLSRRGVKFSQFYNCGKCEPSRAALITGHQFWTHDPNVAIRKDSPNFGEIIQAAGYRTMMIGKWHAAGVPFQRGFHRHFGFMTGGCDFFLGNDTFTLDGKPWPVPKDDFYATYEFTNYADQFIRDEHAEHPDQPFFMYLAYNAPHSPIQAPADQVAKYRGKYLKGWDVIRKERFARQQAIGLAGDGWNFPDRPENVPPWDSLDEKSRDFEDLRMATYAAMVDCVDQGVGRVMRTLKELDIDDNTLVIFMNDNGASPNDRVRRGNFGTAGTTWNVGVAWAHASNTPMKFYKRTQHSGGVTTPFIACWPDGIKPQAEFNDQPLHITDILPTLIEIAETTYPQNFGGKRHPPLPGRSFADVLTDGETLPPIPLHFSLFNNMAVVDSGWRMVTAYDQPWQLYDLTNDRTETRDVADSNPKRLREMLELQKQFSERPDVRLRLKSGEREPEYAPIYKSDGKIGPGARESVPDEKASLKRVKQRATGIQVKELESKQ
ncbi:arylsulfatase [Stieleria varia]|uniref:Arylsulfatase n=1 Tax=Stieleria varia TaxID=2528005 RepID=A0A5C6AQ92_9BACT|nr:arylsulfatase [Stieleria varia]TWU02213.1 Arylsulfatase precursor [Stieleria varia]